MFVIVLEVHSGCLLSLLSGDVLKVPKNPETEEALFLKMLMDLVQGEETLSFMFGSQTARRALLDPKTRVNFPSPCTNSPNIIRS